MVLVFILTAIFILLLSLAFLILTSTLHIEIKNLEATNMRKQIKKQNDYAVIFSLNLGKLKWISIHFNDEKIRKAYHKMKLEKIDIKKLEQDFQWKDLKAIPKLQPKIAYLNLKMMLGLESPVTTSLLVAILSSIIATLLPYLVTDRKKKNYEYKIQPIYQNKNLYQIQFNCIIQVKMVHIINVIFIFLKKERSKSNERTTSNRRPYGYSYE